MAASGSAPEDPIKLDHHGIGFLLNQAARSVASDISEELRLRGLDHADMVLLRNTLRECNYADDTVVAAVLAERLILPLEDVEETAQRLQRDGWLEVSGAGSTMTLRPTKKSLGFVVVLMDTMRWTTNRALNGFTHEEVDALTDMLQRVIRNFDRYAGPGVP